MTFIILIPHHLLLLISRIWHHVFQICDAVVYILFHNVSKLNTNVSVLIRCSLLCCYQSSKPLLQLKCFTLLLKNYESHFGSYEQAVPCLTRMALYSHRISIRPVPWCNYLGKPKVSQYNIQRIDFGYLIFNLLWEIIGTWVRKKNWPQGFWCKMVSSLPQQSCPLPNVGVTSTLKMIVRISVPEGCSGQCINQNHIQSPNLCSWQWRWTVNKYRGISHLWGPAYEGRDSTAIIISL